MEMEIQSLLEKLLDINDSMSRCAASATPATSVTQKLARHRDILHEFTQVSRFGFFFSFLSCVSSFGIWLCIFGSRNEYALISSFACAVPYCLASNRELVDEIRFNCVLVETL